MMKTRCSGESTSQYETVSVFLQMPLINHYRVTKAVAPRTKTISDASEEYVSLIFFLQLFANSRSVKAKKHVMRHFQSITICSSAAVHGDDGA